jgi:hypothetical protein
MPITRIESAEIFVGINLAGVVEQIASHGYLYRIIRQDNRTMVAHPKVDYDPLRVNLWVDKGIVTQATIG